MTTRKRFKRLVRGRAAKTGESYTTALGHFRDQTSGERGMSPTEEPVAIRCSFCGKDKDQVDKIVAGPGVFICDECIRLCLEIITPPDAPSTAVERRARSAPPGERAPLDPTVIARVREYVEETLAQLAIENEGGIPLLTDIDVEATAVGVRVDLITSRPGIVIGPGGTRLEKLRSGLEQLVDGRVALTVVPAEERT